MTVEEEEEEDSEIKGWNLFTRIRWRISIFRSHWLVTVWCSVEKFFVHYEYV